MLIAGDARWLPFDLQRRLRAYVRAGGTVASLGTDSLRRGVRLRPRSLVDPTAEADRDIFGARLRPIQRRPVELLAFPDDKIELFAGTDGRFTGYRAFEETQGVGTGRVQAGAGEQVGRPVIVAYRLGRGLVIRYGLPEFAAHLSQDPNTAALLRRTWTLLSR